MHLKPITFSQISLAIYILLDTLVNVECHRPLHIH